MGVEGNVVEIVEMNVESRELRLSFLGALSATGESGPIALPRSRKVRGLLAYLALSPAAVARGRLCELLWDAPSDPRGELRWSLSKLRAIVGPHRVVAGREAVRLDLAECAVDAIEAVRMEQGGLRAMPAAALRRLLARFRGEFLEGLEIDRCPGFTAWLLGQRRRFRALHAAVLEQLVDRLPESESLPHLEEWLALAPLGFAPHARMMMALSRLDRIPEADEHLAVATRDFARAGLDCAALRDAWRSARASARTHGRLHAGFDRQAA